MKWEMAVVMEHTVLMGDAEKVDADYEGGTLDC